MTHMPTRPVTLNHFKQTNIRGQVNPSALRPLSDCSVTQAPPRIPQESPLFSQKKAINNYLFFVFFFFTAVAVC